MRRHGLPWVCGALLVMGHAVADVPINGRSQNLAFHQREVHGLAAQAYRQRLQRLAGEGKLDSDAETFARVRKVAARVIAQAIRLKPPAADWEWEVHTADTVRIEASSMAGGKILVGLPRAEAANVDEAGIAALLGHEVAHVIAEHVREQLSEIRRLEADYERLDLDGVIALLNWDLSVALRLQPLSRLHELEADDLGIELAATAGFPPRGIAAFYRQLDTGDGATRILDSHGGSDERERAISAFVTYAEWRYAEGLASDGERIRPYRFADSSVPPPARCAPAAKGGC